MRRKFRTIIDIERDRKEEEREAFKGRVSKDAKDILNDIFKSPKKFEKKTNWFLKILKWLGILFLGLLMLNFILGSFWLLRELVKSLFFGG